ncbi:MAG TPA: hypothetical protein VFS63_07875 [Pseudolabrys sp.]|nr:hypothetical protein [Pseudolabrys sp.]
MIGDSMGDRMRGCVLACFLATATTLGLGTAGAQETGQPANGPSSSVESNGESGSEFWSKIDLDRIVEDTPVKSFPQSRSPLTSKPLAVTRSENDDGTGSVSINKPLATPWNVRIGGSISYDNAVPSDVDPTRPLPAPANADQSRAVWADVTVPDVGSINTRIETAADQRKYGTSIARSVPLGNNLSLTAQNKFSVIDSYGAPATTSAAPLAVTDSATAPSQIWTNERKVNLNVLSTGTTFGAGWTTATGDPVTHNTLSADQKLYGSLHVTTSVSDIGQPASSKSITAGFKMNW